MPTSETAAPFTVTPAAREKIDVMMGEQDLAADEKNLRIFVSGGGCGGPSFGLAFDKAEAQDTVVDRDGLSVLIDPVSLPYLQGASIDFVDTEEVTGFKVVAPSLNSAGCGSSGCGSAQVSSCGSGSCG